MAYAVWAEWLQGVKGLLDVCLLLWSLAAQTKRQNPIIGRCPFLLGKKTRFSTVPEPNRDFREDALTCKIQCLSLNGFVPV